MQLQHSEFPRFYVSRITGLDPAGPMFSQTGDVHYLQPDDAHFVDIIHTNAEELGYPSATGHADFWPNGGRTDQPGCVVTPITYVKVGGVYLSTLCSHIRSIHLFAESINADESAFLAVTADNYEEFKQNKTDSMVTANMGFHCSPQARGNYYLQTNGQYPFARNENGIVYSANAAGNCRFFCSLTNIISDFFVNNFL